MPALNVHDTWLRQASRDLAVAEHLAANGFYEWSCFCALQAAEKAHKAIYYAVNIAPPSQGKRGHNLTELSEIWHEEARRDAPDLAEAQASLTQISEAARYPQGDMTLAPLETFNEAKSRDALRHARLLIDFCGPIARGLAERWSEAWRSPRPVGDQRPLP